MNSLDCKIHGKDVPSAVFTYIGTKSPELHEDERSKDVKICFFCYREAVKEQVEKYQGRRFNQKRSKK